MYNDGYDDDDDDDDNEASAPTRSLVQPLPLYSAGFEFGSATSSLMVSSPNRCEATPLLATLSSFLADGDLATLFTNSASSLFEKILRPNEYVLTYSGHTYFLGDLLEQGTHLVETIYLGGGGAYYFEDVIWGSLPGCHIVTVPDPHRANLSGYLALATALPEAHWKHDPWPERFVLRRQ